MADYNINAVTRRVVYSGSAGLGPYSFSFEVLDQDDLAVYFNTTKLTLTTDYTVTINANGTGSITIVTGTNVPSTPTGSDTIIIVGARDIERVTDFVTAGDLRASALNEQLDGLTIFDQQIAEEQKRTLQAPVYDPAHVDDGGTLDMTLPAKSARAGKYLQFNSTTGNPEAGPDSTDVTNLADVATDIALLADIQDGTTATNAITTVSGISANVTTVAGIASNVSTVAGISADVTSVAADATDIGTVATNIASVNTVAGNISEVVAVANDLNEAVSEVETVANDLNEAVSEIETVAASISNVDTVGTNIANVNTVAGIDSNVTTVAGISANVTTVAGISANVTTVAGISADVSTVAADGTDIGTVAGISSNVSTVAGISGDVTTVAGVSSNVTTVATDITNVNTVATNIGDVNSFANQYRIAASAPATSLDEGDLYFDTTQNQMFVYTGSAWVAVSPDLVADTTPQLGGNLDLNGSDITGTGNINNTGTITTDGLTVDGSSTLQNVTVGVDGTYAGNYRTIGFSGNTNGSTRIFGTTNDSDNLYIAAGTGRSINFWTGGSSANRMTIDASGNVGIGGAPSAKLDINNGALGRTLIQYNGTSYNYFDVDNHVWRSAGASEYMRIDSSGNVGIGTASPARTLSVYGSSAIPVRVESSTSDSQIEFVTSGGSSYLGGFNGNMVALTGGTERLRIDSSGNVGIKTTSPDLPLTVDNSSGAAGSVYAHISMGRGTSNRYQIATIKDTPTNDAVGIVFRKGTTEQARIDSSGNLLVGTTNANPAENNVAGIGALANNTLSITRDGNAAMQLNRKTSDGSIAIFRKDGTAVGSIGNDSTELYIGMSVTNNSGFAAGVSGGTPVIFPTGSNGAVRDNAISLGYSTGRWKDLYLSGKTFISDGGSANPAYTFGNDTDTGIFRPTGNQIAFTNGGSESARINSSGVLLVGKTSATITTAGQTVYFGQINGTRDGAQVCTFNRLTDDGTLVDLRQDSVQEGTISVSGTTVSYNGGHLSRWSRLLDDSKDTSIVKGTVMTNLDEMVEWGDEDNEQLNKMAVSSVEGDANVAGVFVNWDDSDDWNDMNVAMTGDMVIRIAQGTTVARGDLLMSAGDGTAKPQGDDIVRSKTIAKVTSTNVSHTYDDGSYCVPCVLMAC